MHWRSGASVFRMAFWKAAGTLLPMLIKRTTPSRKPGSCISSFMRIRCTRFQTVKAATATQTTAAATPASRPPVAIAATMASKPGPPHNR